MLPHQLAERIPRKLIWAFREFLPAIPVPITLPHRIIWTATFPDGLDIWVVGVEKDDRRFVERTVGPGMTVLDLGAHHGLYTTLLSRLVGPEGRVIAFEPSPRERRGLERHLRLNGCNNVTVVPCAVGERSGTAEFFMANSRRSGASGMRNTELDGRFADSVRIEVPVTTIDEYLEEHHIEGVDFVKMDIEGAELAALRGGRDLLTADRRPTIMIEMSDTVTRGWGYDCKEKYDELTKLGYYWYSILSDGSLIPSPRKDHYEGFPNLVAKPAARI